jgi:hypothetical protein
LDNSNLESLLSIPDVVSCREEVRQCRESLPRLSYWFVVHHIADIDCERLLVEPGLAPFAALGLTADGDRLAVLRRALAVIAGSDDDGAKALLGLAVDLAHLRLDRSTIDKIVKEAVMPFPSLMNEFVEEWLEEGREAGQLKALSALLRARFGDDRRVADIAARLVGLPEDDYARRILDAGSLDDLT